MPPNSYGSEASARRAVCGPRDSGPRPCRCEPRAGAHSWDLIKQAEKVLKESGATIENAVKNRAYYDLRRDRIILPYKEQCPTGPAYYQTARTSSGTGRGIRTGSTGRP